MATSTFNSITVPAGTDLYNLAPDLKTMAESATVIIPVADTTARAAVVAATTPSATNPLYVHRADGTTGFELEVSEDGTAWHPVGGRGGLKSASTGYPNGDITTAHGLGYAPSVVICTPASGSSEAVTKLVRVVVWSVDATNFVVRVIRGDTNDYLLDNPVSFYWYAR